MEIEELIHRRAQRLRRRPRIAISVALATHRQTQFLDSDPGEGSVLEAVTRAPRTLGSSRRKQRILVRVSRA